MLCRLHCGGRALHATEKTWVHHLFGLQSTPPLAAVGRREKLGKRALTKQGEAVCHRPGHLPCITRYSSTSSDPSLLQASNLASLTHQQKCSPTKQSLQVQSINPFPKKTFHWTRLFATLVHMGIRSTVFSVLTREAWTFGCTQFLMRYCVGIWKLKVRVDWFKHLWQTPVRTRHHLGPCCWSTEILNRPVVAVAVCWNYNWPGNQPDKGKRSRTAHRGCGVGM